VRPSLRFLGLAVAGWAGVRAYSMGALPAGSLRLIEPSEAKTPPPLMATQFPPIEPAEPAEPMEDPGAYPPASAYGYGYGYGYAPMQQAVPVPGRPLVVPSTMAFSRSAFRSRPRDRRASHMKRRKLRPHSTPTFLPSTIHCRSSRPCRSASANPG